MGCSESLDWVDKNQFFCIQVSVVMESIEGEDFNQVATKPLASMPCGVPGQAFVAFEKPEGACSIGKFSNTLRFYVKEVCT